MSDEPSWNDASTDAGPDGTVGQPGEAGQPEVVQMTGGAGRPRRVAIIAAVAAVAMLGGAGVAYAASTSTAAPAVASASTPKPKPTAVPSRLACPATVPTCPRWRMIPFRRIAVLPGGVFGPGLVGGLFGAVHGQFVVAKPGGGYQTVDVQRGKVTAVGGSSITLRSPDGFTAHYAVSASTMVDAQRNGIGSIKVGDQVSLTATGSGSTLTAASITDLTLLVHSHKAFSFSWQSAS